MKENDFLTTEEEKTCEMCFKIAALYNRRENMIKDDHESLGMRMDTGIKLLLKDLREWMLKNE